MARVKRGVTARRRHKKLLKQAKGYYGARSRVYRVAKQAVTKAGQYAYIGRKQRKRQFRSLWIVRINAAARMYGLSYSRFIAGLTMAGITVDRKVMADLAVHDIAAFGAIAEQAKLALGDGSAPAGKPAAKTAKPAEKAAEPAAKPAAKPAKAAKGDDLTKIEGVGPKIAELLHNAGIDTFAMLADTDAEKIKGILTDAGSHFASHDPTTWPRQSALAAAGKWDELDALQRELNGGRIDDDLTKIEGVGPKIAELLNDAGIGTFAALADTDAEKINGILTDAGSHFASHDPTTWAQQSALAAAGKWDELEALQDELKGGRVA